MLAQGTIVEFNAADALGWIELDGGGRLRFGSSSLGGDLRAVIGARVEVSETAPGFGGVLKAVKVFPVGHHEAEARRNRQWEARERLAEGDLSFGGDGFLQAHDFSAFVEQLYAAGATRVMVEENDTVLVAHLPPDADARARLFSIYNAEVDRFGEEFGGEEPQGHEMTRDEALAIGVPEAEGEFVLEDLHAIDRGQITLSFWWD